MNLSDPIPRRSFLADRAAVAVAAAGAVVDADAPVNPPSDRTASPLLTFARRAMACRFAITICADDSAGLADASAALDEVDRLERQMTVYQSDSEISRINTLAADKPVRVEPRLFELLRTARRIHDETDSAFDIAAGALVRAWGFLRGPKRVPSDTELAEAQARSGSRFVELDTARRTIRFTVPGVELNLGSIGKGWALDRAAKVLSDRTRAQRFLLNAAGSSLLARGDPNDASAGETRSGWWVGITDPRDPSRRIGRLRLRDGALSTSGATFRHFVHEGRKYGHTLDPRTGRPAEGVLSVTVLAPTAAEADALSTALYVMGPASAEAFCRRNPRIRALMIPDSRSDLMVLNFGVAECDWEPGSCGSEVRAEPRSASVVTRFDDEELFDGLAGADEDRFV